MRRSTTCASRTAGCLLLAALANHADATGPVLRSVVRIEYGPSPVDTFRRPMALAVDRGRGILVVGDTGNHRLLLFDASGRFRGGIPCTPNASERRLCEPRGLAFDSGGRLFVAGTLTRGVEVLHSTGATLAELNALDAADAGSSVQGVAVDSSGRIWLAVGGNQPAVLALRADGRTELRIDRAGGEALGSVTGVAVSGDDSLVAVLSADGGDAIKLFHANGIHIASFGRHGEGEGTFSLPGAAAWGPGKTLWVTDTIRGSISVFDAKGTYLGRIGGFGRGAGQFCYPVACAFLADDRLVVLERGTARIQVLEVGMTESPDQVSGPVTAGSDAR